MDLNGDLNYVLLKREFVAKEEVATVWGGKEGGVVYGKTEVVFLMRDLGPMIIISDLSQFSWRKLVCIQVLISVRQLVSVERVAVVMDLVEM